MTLPTLERLGLQGSKPRAAGNGGWRQVPPAPFAMPDGRELELRKFCSGQGRFDDAAGMQSGSVADPSIVAISDPPQHASKYLRFVGRLLVKENKGSRRR